MREAPITYVGNSAKTSPKTLSEMKNTTPYYCLVSTLNPEGSDWAYHKQRFDVIIPNGVVKQAQKQGKDKKWVSYEFPEKYALTRTNADTLAGGWLSAYGPLPAARHCQSCRCRRAGSHYL